MELPSERLEVLLTQPVAVARSGRRVIAGAIALDRQDELPRPLRVLRNQIDPVLRRAPLRQNLDALRREARRTRPARSR